MESWPPLRSLPRTLRSHSNRCPVLLLLDGCWVVQQLIDGTERAWGVVLLFSFCDCLATDLKERKEVVRNHNPQTSQKLLLTCLE